MTEVLGVHSSEPLALQEHEQKIGVAIAETAKKDMADADAVHQDNTAKVGVATTEAQSIFFETTSVVQRAQTAATAAAAEVGSMFVGGGPKDGKKPVPSSLVPLSYSDKKAIADKVGQAPVSPSAILVEKVKIAHQSITGKSETSKTPAPIKGGAMPSTPEALKKELAIIRDAMEHPYENDPKRLEHDAKNNAQPAQAQAQQSHGPGSFNPPTPHFGNMWGGGSSKKSSGSGETSSS